MTLKKTWAALAFVGALVGSAVGCGSNADTCQIAGRTVSEGQQLTCVDGCNTCLCKSGQPTSTAIGCTGAPGPAAGKFQCKEGGTWHPHGTSWTCADGCSSCSCDDGKVSTQAEACTSDPTAGSSN